MATKKQRSQGYEFTPDYLVPPGKTLLETITALGITQRELAKRTGLSPKTVNQITKGISPISHKTAILLERATDVPANMWNGLEAIYRGKLAALEEEKCLEESIDWLKAIPIKELITRGVIRDTGDKVSLSREALGFFGVATPDAWRATWEELVGVAMRRSPSNKGTAEAIATWLQLCLLEAKKVECQPYDKKSFRSALEEARSLTTCRFEPALRDLYTIMAKVGVACVVVRSIKKAPLSGAVKWLSSDKVMLALTRRGKTGDKFWFSFFHEAGHILLDGKKLTVDCDSSQGEEEDRANRFAEDILIPKARTQDFELLKTPSDIKAFASSISVAPGIVVGRMQREGLLGYNHRNHLMQRIHWPD